MKPLFRVINHPDGLLPVMNGPNSSNSKASYTKYNPQFFNCDFCEKEDELNFEVVKNGTSYWVCSEICVTALILSKI